jgi:hypothetical protein
MAGSDLLYLRKLLNQLCFAQQSPTPVYEDNTECIDSPSSVETTSSVVGSAPNPLTFGSTSPTRSFRMVNCGSFAFRHHLSWRRDILTKGLHYPQWQACVEGILSKVISTKGALVLKRVWFAKAYKSSHVAP